MLLGDVISHHTENKYGGDHRLRVSASPVLMATG